MPKSETIIAILFSVSDELVEQPFSTFLSVLPNPEAADPEVKAKIESSARKRIFEVVGKELERLGVEIEYESFYGQTRPVAVFRYAPIYLPNKSNAADAKSRTAD